MTIEQRVAKPMFRIAALSLLVLALSCGRRVERGATKPALKTTVSLKFVSASGEPVPCSLYVLGHRRELLSVVWPAPGTREVDLAGAELVVVLPNPHAPYAPMAVHVSELLGEETATVILKVGLIIRGEVLDDLGVSAGGVEVIARMTVWPDWLQNDHPSWDGHQYVGNTLPHWSSARTDSNGQFRIVGLLPGQHHVYARPHPRRALVRIDRSSATVAAGTGYARLVVARYLRRR